MIFVLHLSLHMQQRQLGKKEWMIVSCKRRKKVKDITYYGKTFSPMGECLLSLRSMCILYCFARNCKDRYSLKLSQTNSNSFLHVKAIEEYKESWHKFASLIRHRLSTAITPLALRRTVWCFWLYITVLHSNA